MKLLIIFFVITFFIIDGLQSAPAIHPISVHTIPLHTVTANPTSAGVTTEQSIVPSVSTYSTELTTSTPSSSSTTAYQPSWWHNQNSVGRIMLRVFLYVFVFTLVCELLKSVCKSKKQAKPCKKDSPVVLKNKMYVSTIGAQREGPPPTYADVHNI